MNRCHRLLALLTTLSLALSGCAADGKESPELEPQDPTAHYLVAVEDEPDTVDFQCTSIHYTIAQNVFDRLVDMGADAEILPALAESWTVSEDRLTYSFHLREGVTFSNGSPLTSSDVAYTFERLLTHPESCNQEVVNEVLGAEELSSGAAQTLAGFQVLSDLDFTVTLRQPFEAFLACLSMPGGSILDKETTQEAGERFGHTAEWTIGTGSFILESWEPGKGMLLRANPNCWQGPPKCDGLDLRFMTDAEEIRQLFEDGGLDVLNLEDVGNAADFFLHGDIYQDRLFRVQRISIAYIALNQSVRPLNDVRVRKALQLALDRSLLLDVAYSGNGIVENGIMPHNLYGFNPDLPAIPYDPEQARTLLNEAGYGNGFTMKVGVSAASSLAEMTLLRAAVSMWEKIGVRADLKVMPDSEFMAQRKSGSLACYTATWTADFNDPDNFFYTFFGDRDKTSFRSLCYPREEIMARVRAARAISTPKSRIREYQDLERIIVQEDAAWIPLFTKYYNYVSSERLRGIGASWNGSVKNTYRHMSVSEVQP